MWYVFLFCFILCSNPGTFCRLEVAEFQSLSNELLDHVINVYIWTAAGK